MSWRRGATRAFVVLWIVWGVVVGVFSADEIDAWKPVYAASAPTAWNILAVCSGASMPLPSACTGTSIQEAHLAFPEVAGGPTYVRDWPRALEMLGLALVVGGLVPGLLLLGVRWVWDGFC